MIRSMTVTLVGLLLVGACGGEQSDGLAFSLAATTYVVGVAVIEVDAVGEDAVSGGVDMGGNPITQQELLIYRHRGGRQLAAPFDGAVLEDPFRFWREPRFQSDLGVMSRSGPELILLLQRQVSASDSGVDLSAQIVVLDASGAVAASDWVGTAAGDDLETLVGYMADRGIDLVAGLAAFASAAADDELGRPVSNSLGAELLAVVSD